MPYLPPYTVNDAAIQLPAMQVFNLLGGDTSKHETRLYLLVLSIN